MGGGVGGRGKWGGGGGGGVKPEEPVLLIREGQSSSDMCTGVYRGQSPGPEG